MFGSLFVGLATVSRRGTRKGSPEWHSGGLGAQASRDQRDCRTLVASANDGANDHVAIRH
jgi:hypothetical protein